MSTQFGLGLVSADYGEGWGSSYANSTAHTVVQHIIGTETMSTDPRPLPLTVANVIRTLFNSYTYPSGVGQPGNGLFGIYDPSSPSSWVQKTTASSTATSSSGAAQKWSISNPYGAAAQYDSSNAFTAAFLIDQDTASIRKYAASDFAEDAAQYYDFTAGGTYTGGAVGLDVYDSNYLVAGFTRYSVSSDYVYTYGNSDIVLLDMSDITSVLDTATANKNANGITVHSNSVYVTSFGDQQNAGGNTSSELEVFTVANEEFTKVATITTSMLPDTSGNDYTVHFGNIGDFLGVEIVPVDGNNRAIILLAHYDTSYTKYDYELLSVSESALQAGTLSGAICVTGTVSPAGAAWGLLKDDNDDLYLVDGVHIKKIDTSDLSMTTVCSASDFTSDGTSSGTAGYLINAAGIVVSASASGTAETRALKGMPAPHVSVTKMAHRLITPEELKKRQKK